MPSPTSQPRTLSRFRDALLLDEVLRTLQSDYAGYELLEHWTQGEFHHDVVFRLGQPDAHVPAPVLVVSTNCNGGVKEVALFSELPERLALWNARCPDNPDFAGEPPPVLDSFRTVHWFDPCELLVDDARSELRPEFRERQTGGGWVPRGGER